MFLASPEVKIVIELKHKADTYPWLQAEIAKKQE